MGNRNDQFRPGTIKWLLEPEKPSVRYRALRHLLCRPEDDAAVAQAKAAFAKSRVVRARQQPGGYWGDPTTPYKPKCKAAYWTLMVLGHLGLTREDERVQRAVRYIFQF